MIGYLLFGVAIAKTATLPRLSGVLVAVGAPAHLLGFGVAQLVSTAAWSVAVLGSVSLGAGLAWSGYRLWRTPGNHEFTSSRQRERAGWEQPVRWGKVALLVPQWVQRPRPSRRLQFVIVGGIRPRDCRFVSMAARFTFRFAELTPVCQPSCSRREWARSHPIGTGSRKSSLRRSEVLPTTVAVLAGAGVADGPRDAQTIATELRDALREAAIEPPYVLAGHSFGGMPVRAFADLYPELTAGLVLVDASHPDQWVRWPTPHADKMLEVSQRIFGWLGWLGVLRALNLSRGISAGLPARQVAELRAGAALPGFATTEAAQIHSWSVQPRAAECRSAAR